MKISLLGCGWLGLPLAEMLLENGFSIKGSTTTESKLEVLKKAGISSYLISIGADGISVGIDAFLEESEILIIDIPPQLRGAGPENFVLKIKNLIPFIEKSAIRKVLFISSISVYSGTLSNVSETTIPNPETESGKQLVTVEKLLRKNKNFKTTIVRFGGLVGGSRHPVRFLSGKKNLENPQAAINLIHRDDCIGIIARIIIMDKWNETFNAVTPYHPTREAYYQSKAMEYDLILPEFDLSDSHRGKIISSQKIQTVLDYSFQKVEDI
jgi:nucleoside-diphosphate-sugar epimerase